MSGTFYGLEIAKTGLFAGNLGMEITGQNVSNASTTGYTRQKLNMSSIPPSAAVITYAGSNVGGGVKVDYVEQVRDKFLDQQYRDENSDYSMWNVKADTYYYIEDVFNATSDSGISNLLEKFYDSLEQLAESPDSKEIRTLVKQSGVSLVESINSYANQLTDLQGDQDTGISTDVKKINDLITQIDDLNTSITKFEINGQPANDLRDKRNLALDNLSQLVDISYEENSDGKVSIYFGSSKNNNATRDDYCLLDGDTNTQYKLELTEDQSNYYEDANQFNRVSITSKNGNAIDIDGDNIEGGELKGYFDCRDGDTAINMGIPYILAQLDKLAQGIADAYNTAHKAGYGIPNDENGNESKTGLNFFDDGSGDAANINARNISVSSDILDSVYNIAASDTKVDLSAPNTNIGNYNNATNLVNVASSTTLPGITGIDDFLVSIISDVGVQASHCNEMLDNHNTLFENVTNNRLSVTGVSIDEEMTNLIAYEKAYKAASRVITVIDDMLDTLINGTGRVGR